MPFMLLVFSVSNFKAPFVKLKAPINRINHDKSMIMQCVYKAKLNKDVSRPRQLHLLAPPLFFYYFL